MRLIDARLQAESSMCMYSLEFATWMPGATYEWEGLAEVDPLLAASSRARSVGYRRAE